MARDLRGFIKILEDRGQLRRIKALVDGDLEIAEISNQSTGFCPEPESWFSVSQALDRIPLDHPGKFTINFIFRRCVKCGLLNLVKENLFFCADCNTELPRNWNCNLVQ